MLTVSLFASVCVSFTWRDNWLENVVNELCATFWLAVRWGSVHSPPSSQFPSLPFSYFASFLPTLPPAPCCRVAKVNKCHRCQMMDVKVAFGNTWHTFPRASPQEDTEEQRKGKGARNWSREEKRRQLRFQFRGLDNAILSHCDRTQRK